MPAFKFMAAALLLSTASAFAQTPTAGKALVYVYRTPGQYQALVPYSIYDSEKKLVTLPHSGEWAVLDADPGEMSLTRRYPVTMTITSPSGVAKTTSGMVSSRPLTLQVAAGMTYYVNVETLGNNKLIGLRTEAKARKEMQKCEEVKATGP